MKKVFMLRKTKLIVMIAVSILLMVGCNLKQKIGESITEGIMEKAIGDEADIDIDGENISFTNEEGDEVTFDEEDGLTIEGEDGSVVASGGEYDWPEGQAADYLPKFKDGTISYILNSDATCMLLIDEVELEDYKAYVKEVVDKGYIVDKVESNAEDMQLYTGKSEEGVAVTVYFINSEGSMQLTVDASGKK